MVDSSFLEVDAAHPTPSLEQSCTPQPHPLPSTSATLSTSSTSTYASHPSLTQVLIYKIGNLASSANAKTTLASYGERLDNLTTARVEAREKSEDNSINFTELRREGEVPLTEMPEIVPHFELRVDAPTSIAEQPINVEDDVSDDDVVEETNEEKFMRDNENVIIETQ
ncbi:hypothetical protein KY290_036599 [Solanum tuberosum]|uniref:Integrase core domain containing protein n=1 Tax=Solanum tuberosum TaxID=4113 RepID=A0ABQ7TUG1_SOLTU|nr:hypothetical protein KY290_036599 [Solanum tuberosum]